VYKSGQAGVTKASVSITFNNEDKENSPLGFEEHDKITVTRQIAIGGRNKYLINGKTAQPDRVKNLFHSVQLNVNNPHFLIMQASAPPGSRPRAAPPCRPAPPPVPLARPRSPAPPVATCLRRGGSPRCST